MLPEPLKCTATPETPEVLLDAGNGQYDISGRSLPENAHAFFQPIIHWFRKLLRTQPTIEVELNLYLDYYNSSTGRYLMELMLDLESHHAEGGAAKIVWNADSDDDLMIEKGTEFQQLLKLPVEVREIGA